ncbi:MAG: amino acid ABC transporter substrate-binding protein [Pikeienuella sp.]
MRNWLFALLCAVTVTGPAYSDVLEEIRKEGSLTLGYRTDAPPFSFLSDDGEPAGLAVDLCEDVASSLKNTLGINELTVFYFPVTAATRFEKLNGGEIDILCGPTSATLSRRQKIDFSIPYFVDGSSVVFRTGQAEVIEDLDGQNIGVLKGTTTEKVVTNLVSERDLDAELILYDTHVRGLSALDKGDISAYFGDQAILRYQLGRMRPETPLSFSANQFSFEPYALAMKRGENALRLEVDRALSTSFKSGRIYSHISKTLGDVALSDLARAVYQVVTLPD